MLNKYIHSANLRFHGSLLLGVCMLIALLSISPALASSPSGQALPGEMLVYSPKKSVDLSTLVALGPPEALGGQVLTGSPQLYGRFDFQQGNMMGGLFMATTGMIRVTFPFTEHATILEGEVTLTDETGKTQTFKAGDSYFIRQGSVILWDVKGAYVVKSFFNVTEPAAQ